MMLIFWDKRLVFLATPKAGSTAIEAALEPLASVAITRPAALKHTDLAAWRTHVSTWLGVHTDAIFTTVALMREPVDWLRSWYRFKLRDDHDDPDHQMRGVSFADFAGAYCRPGGPRRLGIGTQSGFLRDGPHTMDHIFRYEDMAVFVEFLEDRLDCGIELPRVNVPPSVEVALNPDQERALRQAMAGDLALYDRL